MDKSAGPTGPGLIGSLAGVAKNSLGLFVTRLELAALELSEVRNHVLQLIVAFALAVLAGLFGIAYASAMVVYLAWDAMGWKILPVMACAFLLLAAGFVAYARGLLKQNKLSLPATMAELKADRDMLL